MVTIEINDINKGKVKIDVNDIIKISENTVQVEDNGVKKVVVCTNVYTDSSKYTVQMLKDQFLIKYAYALHPKATDVSAGI